MLFDWRAAITCFSVASLSVCSLFTILFFEKGREEGGAAFLVATMILVFVSGGLVFA